MISILGGGYAGLATAIELKRLNCKEVVTLYDSRPNHQKLTQWHKLARGKRAQDYEVPFEKLAGKFGFRFEQKKLDLTNLAEFEASTVVVAQGAHSVAKPAGVITLDDLRDDIVVQDLVRGMTNKHVAVIGGGPTGVQFSFEFAARGNHVDLYEARDRLLPLFDNALSQAAQLAAAESGITIHLETSFVSFENGRVVANRSAQEVSAEADYVIFVPGVKATPAFTCDPHGRVEYSKGQRFYAAGDNSHFAGKGLNTKSAQAAVRKGQCVAREIVLQSNREYNYSELGYFVSLGPRSAVGYLLSQKTAFSGAPALAMKEIIEKQYDLFLAGFNAYF